MKTSNLPKEYPWARFHTLESPVRFDALSEVLDEIRAMRTSGERPNAPSAGKPLIGHSENIRCVRTLIEQVAPTATTVLIKGQSGTGKEVVARQIHERSGRAGRFVAINCGAIPGQLLESELFGSERGAFTGAVAAREGRFEQANGGTFFLDEIGDMPSAMQAKLLRVLEERVIERVGGTTTIPVDVRLVAATHRDLPQRIAEGKFREDLYYRLSVFPIEISPLAERPDDIPLLAEEFLRRARIEKRLSVTISDEAMAALQRYGWAGNVRELANLIERLAVVKPDGVIRECDLPWPIVDRDEPGPGMQTGERVRASGTGTTLPPDGVDLRQHLAEIEKDLITRALLETGGVVQRAAKVLGVGRTTLIEKIKRYSIDIGS